MPHGISFDTVIAQGLVGEGTLRRKWVEWSMFPCLASETRLVEVLESVCSKSDFECHRLLELSEELVESWWFHK